MPSAGRRDRHVQVGDDGWEIPPAWLMIPTLEEEEEDDYGEDPSSGY